MITKGKWIYKAKLSGSENHKGYTVGNERYPIADIYPLDTDGIEGKANAQAIASLPDLIEALNETLTDLDKIYSEQSLIARRILAFTAMEHIKHALLKAGVEVEG